MSGPVALGWEDYVVFGLMVLGSCGVGIYHGVRQSRTKTENKSAEYLLGSGKMSLIPVMFSLGASYISAVLFLGIPAETYFFGGQYWLEIIGTALGSVLAAIIYVPVLYPLKLVSIYEYLWRRFESRFIQTLGAIDCLLVFIVFSATIFFAPSLALAAVSGIPPWVSIIVAVVVTMIFTFGGFKAVVWTDVLQGTVMLVGMLVVAVRAIYVVGWTEMWELNEQYERTNIFVFDPNPYLRLNFWGLVFGNAITYTTVYGTGQVPFQRYASLPSMTQANVAVIGVIWFTGGLLTLACLCGMSIFAFYAKDGCDPLFDGRIGRPDEIMMYFAADALSVPGLPGLFMAAVWAGSLSSASSVYNAASAVIWKDLIQPFIKVPEHRVMPLIKGMVILVALVSLGVAMVLLQVEGSVLGMLITFATSLMGPLAAIFLVGVFLPFINWQGGSAGMLVGLIYGNWLSFGSFFYGGEHPPPGWPAPHFNCSVSLNMTAPEPYEPQGVEKMYSVGFLWYKAMTTGIAILTMIIVSLLTGKRNPKTVPKELLHPCIRNSFGGDVSQDNLGYQHDEETRGDKAL